MDPEGHEPPSRSRHDNDPSISTNKHLTRLVRFSILQARRSSHASKVAQQNKGISVDAKQANHVQPSPSAAGLCSARHQGSQKAKKTSPATEATEFPFHLGGFNADKERPSTEVLYEYNDAPGRVVDDIGVVDVPADPPIMEDLSASLTLSAGDHSSYSGSLSEDRGVDTRDMDMLLAPDSGVHHSSSNELYNSAEMYSSSGNYEGSGSSDISSDSSDSIMRRVEEEIANARKASNDAQARLAYFTQRQKELTPVMTDSYSFDFDNIETSDQLQNMLDVDDGEQLQVNEGTHDFKQGQAPSLEENFNSAMGVIGKEFNGGSADVEEKVDIEVVLAPPQHISPQRKQMPASPRSPAFYNRRSPRGFSKSPQHRVDDSVDLDEAVISAVFSEKSIESLPVKESIPDVFSEPSMDSLPTQPSVAPSSVSKPASHTSHPDIPLSPGSQKRHNKLPNMNRVISPRQLSIETDSNFAAKAPMSPLASSPSKLPSTPREPNTPSYRERLENKLKILGSRYPVSPSTKASTPASTKGEKRDGSISPSKVSKVGMDKSGSCTPKDTIMSPATAASPLGEAYDGLENRIKDLLARTLNPGPSDAPQPGENDMAYQSSPSAELKAIKKLLEQGVAAAAAAEEKKRELQGQLEQDTPQESQTGGQADELDFPVLTNGSVEGEQSQLSQSKSHETTESVEALERLPMRSVGLVPPVIETSDNPNDAEPSIACSTSEEILEALDSFSQSTEFKSKSRNASNARPSPQKQKLVNAWHSLDGKVEEFLKEIEATKETHQQPTEESKPDTSLQTQNAVKPAEPEADKQERCNQGTELLVGGTDVEDITDGAEHSSAVPTSRPLEVSDNSSPVPGEETVATNNRDLNDEQHDEKSDYESCAEASRDEEGNEGITVLSTTDSKPANRQECQSPDSTDAPAKKTPSVLNAALSRPSLTDAKERRNERRARQKATTNQTDANEEGKQVDDSAATVDSSSSNPSGDQVTPTPTVVANSDIAEFSERSANQSEEDRVADPEPVSEPNPEPVDASRVPSALVIPASESETHQESRKGQSILASLVDSNKEPMVDPPNPASEPNAAILKAGSDSSAPAKVKSVTVQSPKSFESEASEKVEPAHAERATSRQDRKIRFRDPYPTPKPCRKPRSTEDIQHDHSCKPSQNDKKIRWKEPKGDLKRLLVAALDSSVSRRANACGALKVISKVEKNKVVLVRTKGFLEALVFVATDEITTDEEVKEDARARAVSCMYNVCHLKENRLIVCTHSGLLECLVKTINEDRGEARTEACGILAQLAKNPMCRDVMIGVEELLSTLASVLKGTIDPEEKMLEVLSQDVTEDIQSSYSEMSSVLSEEHIPFPKSPRNAGKDQQQVENKVRANCSIRKQKSEMYDQYFELARLSACAALMHLSKQCSVLDHFCSNVFLLESIVHVARDNTSRLHGKCLEMLCNVSKLPGNTAMMTRFPGMVDTLVSSGYSRETMDRIWSLRTLQNLTSNASSKAQLATSTLLTLLINCVTSKNTGEQHAAMATLLNLSTDPSAVVPITSTKNVLATLVYLAHHADSTSDIRLMACNALATVGLWLQTVSGFGSIPEDTRRVLLPSHKTAGWLIWD